MARLNAETRAIVARLRRAAGRPLAEASAMPPAIYASPAFFALEQETVFAHAWSCAGRAESLAAAGDYLTCHIGRQPVAVMRQRDGTLKAFSNVCRHRMMALLEGRGSCRRIVSRIFVIGKRRLYWIDNQDIKSLDHDQETGKPRGLLCDSCNTGLGRFKNGENHIQSALDYLKGAI